jgi:hypothetical protein
MPPNNESSEIVRDLLTHAIPVSPQSTSSFVTHEEFKATIKTIETRIELAATKQRQWVLSGVIAILLGGVSGYVSLVNKLDRLGEALPKIAQVQDGRAPWIQRQEQRDSLQDQSLKKLDKSYQPLPYSPPPQ